MSSDQGFLFSPPASADPERSGAPDRSADVSTPGGGTPLAERMRPRSLDEMVGQDAVVGTAGFLRRAIAEDRVPSMILWGPPGCGKTTLAEIVAGATSARFVPFSAVTSGIKEVKQVMADAARFRRAEGRRTLLFVDEIHRFNRAQQDAFLPYVESGDIVLVGATTENPSFEIVGALLSRCRVVVLEGLTEEAQRDLLRRALDDDERGLGESVREHGITVDDAGLDALIHLAGGDARHGLNLLELVVTDAVSAGGSRIDAAAVGQVAQRKVHFYDKSGEEHFNLLSAFHKSLRESDPDAAAYYLVRMLASGEPATTLARRMVRFASEDIGLADPNAVRRALDAWDAYDRLGSPEGDLALVQAALYLGAAPKSNAAYTAHKALKRAVAEHPDEPVPPALRNAPTRMMKDLGYGEGFVYAHDAPEGIGGMECLPESLRGNRFYEPKDVGVERRFRDRLAELDRLRAAARQRHG